MAAKGLIMRLSTHFQARLAVTKVFLAVCVFGPVVFMPKAWAVLQETHEVADLAISGAGYFIARDPDGRIFYTRNGSFKIDNNGFLVTNEGFRVQGSQDDPKIIGDLRLIINPPTSPWVN